jgi:fructokinase
MNSSEIELGPSELQCCEFLPPLVAGEVLFDHFPGGERVIGGAPFNVAWNLFGLGAKPTFLSCVGNDAEGDEVKRRMKEWGLSTDAMHTSTEKSTGRVEVSLIDGQPSYEIVDDQAFDFIDQPPCVVNSKSHSLLYTGSLALRNQHSRKTLMSLAEESGLPCFVDVNVRPPWFDLAWASKIIAAATWIKLSEGELAMLTDRHWEEGTATESDVTKSVEIFCDRFSTGTDVATVFVTLGHRGACAIAPDGNAAWAAPAPLTKPVEDPVGAGDAFVAGAIYGLLCNWSIDQTLQFACRVAANACTLKGATSSDRAHYQAAFV